MHAYWMRSKRFNSIEMPYSFRDVHLQMELGKWYHILEVWKVSLVFALLKVCSLSLVNFLIHLKCFAWGIQQIAAALYIIWSTALKGLILYPLKHFDLLYSNMHCIESILIYCMSSVFQSALSPSAEGRVHCVCGLLYDSVCWTRMRSDTHWPMENI